MASLKYSDLLPHVLAEVYGCSDVTAEHAIRDAVIAFCGGSRLWKYVCDPVSVQARVAEYSVDIPADAALVTILSASLDGELLDPRSTDQLDAMDAGWRSNIGTPRYYTQLTPEDIVLVSVPSSAVTNGLVIVAAIQPSRKSTTFPAWINDRYQDVLVAGAKARLLRQRGQAWFDPGTAAAYQSDFADGVAAATVSGQQSLVRSNGRTTSQH